MNVRVHEMKYAYEYYKRNDYVHVNVENWFRYKRKQKYGTYKVTDAGPGILKGERVVNDG